MQPFGLLNFLQTLLNSSQQNPDIPTTVSNQENAENTTADSAENSENTAYGAPVYTDNQKAVLSFFDEHEKRAKTLRK